MLSYFDLKSNIYKNKKSKINTLYNNPFIYKFIKFIKKDLKDLLVNY